MYATITLLQLPQAFTALAGADATAASLRVGADGVIVGTGSVFDFSRIVDWYFFLKGRVPLHIDAGMADESRDRPPDLRPASRHLANIREVLNPAVADLVTVFGVSRQAIYKWLGGEANPEPEKFERIRALSHAADAFRDAGIARASSLLKMKAFDGRSLLDLAATGQLQPSHVQTLIDEARAMDAAYARSGLARTKAKPSEDWRTEVSLPGSPE